MRISEAGLGFQKESEGPGMEGAYLQIHITKLYAVFVWENCGTGLL
jgi:hypothetical protein